MELKLKEMRLKMNLTQKELAEAIGCSSGAYSKYEVGDRAPSLEILCKLADHYEVSVDCLLGRTPVSMDSLSESERALIKKCRSSDRFVLESALVVMEVLDKKQKQIWSQKKN